MRPNIQHNQRLSARQRIGHKIFNMNNLLIASLSILATFSGCADTDMTVSEVVKPDSLVATDYIREYDVLSSYATAPMKVGSLVSGEEYDNHDVSYRILKRNANEVEPQKTMMHGVAFRSDGTVDSTSIEDFVETVTASGQSVYGGSLCTHTQQNSDYLNYIIKPDVYSKDGSPLTSRCLIATNTISGTDKSQQFDFAFANTPGVTPNNQVEFDFMVKGSVAGQISLTVSGGNDFSGKVNVTTSWTKVRAKAVIGQGMYNLRAVVFNIGAYVGTLYIDDMSIYTIDDYGDKSSNKLKTNANLDDAELTEASLTTYDDTSTGITQLKASEVGDGYDANTYEVEKTAEQKATILGQAMDSWIDGVMRAADDNVSQWEVVSCPLKEDATSVELRSASDSTASLSDFYWQDYLGLDYAVQAFKSAASHGKASDTLYIAETGMESSEEKCEALIDYVDYLEQQGARVDGIAARINVTTATADTVKIERMMNLLAATGKIIRLSRLTVSLPEGAQLTDANMREQKRIYHFIISKYMELVPQAQRGGISFGQLIDTTTSNAGLWDTSYNRKHAYAGCVEAMMGE